MTMTLIATGQVTGSAGDIQFTNIPQTYDDLYVLISAGGRITGGNEGAVVAYTATGQPSSLSNWRGLYGNGTGVSGNTAAYPIVGNVQYLSTTNYFNSISINILNYKAATKKVFQYDSVTENNGSAAHQSLGTSVIDDLNPITFLGFGDGSAGGGFKVGSQIWLYGIKKGSGGATVA
jgi:hypothetical protein